MHRWCHKWRARQRRKRWKWFYERAEVRPVSRTEGSRNSHPLVPLRAPRPPWYPRSDSSQTSHVCRLEACRDRGRLHHCDQAHKKSLLYHALPPSAPTKTSRSAASIETSTRRIPPALTKQIQNELLFLILINHPSSQPPGTLLVDFFIFVSLPPSLKNSFSPARIDCCLRLAMCLFMSDGNHRILHAVAPKRVWVFLSLCPFLSLNSQREHIEEAAFIAYSSCTIKVTPNYVLPVAEVKRKRWGVNLSALEGCQGFGDYA